jgi:hypothetical protein
MPWLAAKGLLGLARWGWLLVALAGVLATIAAITGNVKNTLDKATETGREAGESAAVAAGQATTLEQIGNANEAGTKVRDDIDGARYAACLLDNGPATASNCERYKPVEPLPDRQSFTPANRTGP